MADFGVTLPRTKWHKFSCSMSLVKKVCDKDNQHAFMDVWTCCVRANNTGPDIACKTFDGYFAHARIVGNYAMEKVGGVRFQHFVLVFGVVSVIRWFIPHYHRNMLQMLLKLIKVVRNKGGRCSGSALALMKLCE